MPSFLTRLSYPDLPGWEAGGHEAALAAFRRSSREILDQGTGFMRSLRHGGSREAWLQACRMALEADGARMFFETWFSPWLVHDEDRPEGLFTGYFEPEVWGSRSRSARFSVPLYRRPPDLVSFSEPQRRRSGLDYGRIIDGEPQPYLTRREIEMGALAGQGLELVWLEDWADAFFIHIQGSGRVLLAEGGVMRLTYGAKSGRPYTGIGALLVERGELSRENMSMQAIRRWMAKNPSAARELMWENHSFIFFREAELADPQLGALGAQHVQLTPRRSVAVDRSEWAFGTPVWLDTEVPAGEDGLQTPFRQLLIAQDTGSAIRGAARADVYWGFGAEGAAIAGPMKSSGRMAVLLPHAVVAELGLVP